jgi:hypothetical protein
VAVQHSVRYHYEYEEFDSAMSDLKDLIDAVNLPKVVLERTDAFLRTLLGPATAEAGELLADKIRFRRFKNQVQILRAAQDMLDAANLRPKQVPLRTLVSLIESASLEEDPDIQRMWATLLSNTSQATIGGALQTICIQVLSGISAYEAQILSAIFSDYLKREPAKLEKIKQWNLRPAKLHASSFFYQPDDLFRWAGISPDEGEFLLDNLLRFGLLRFETPEIEEGEVRDPKYVYLTELGLKTLKACHVPPSQG